MKGMGRLEWLLLNQHLDSLERTNSRVSVLEELVSSEQQLVQVLVSGKVSSQTSKSLGHGRPWNNQRLEKAHLQQE